jgi:methenyltetrahydromethanopterin cyclohydrolase
MPTQLTDNINSATAQTLRQRLSDATALGIEAHSIGGATVVQFAGQGKGTIDAGILLAQMCLGLDGKIQIDAPARHQINRPSVSVAITNPLVACMGCQYAGWPLSVGKYFAMASGPIRLLRGKETVLTEYNLTQNDLLGVVVLESAKLPDSETIEQIVHETGVDAKGLFVCVARTSSIPGSLQVVARSVETAMHKLHELSFDISTVQSGTGTAPLPPETDDDMVALGWTNDAMLYGADVHLKVATSDAAIESIIEKTPSCSSQEFGSPFLELFKKYDYDFYKIDKMLFSPAKITIENVSSGNSFSAGKTCQDILKLSFGM